MSACGQTPDQSKLAKLGQFDSSSSSRENILWTMLRGLCLNTKTEYRAFHQLGCFMRRRRKRRRRRRSVSRRVTRGTHSSAFCHSTTSAQPFSPIRNYFVKPSKRFCKSQLLCPIIVFSCPVQFSFQLFNCALYLFILINVEPGTRVGCCQMRGSRAGATLKWPVSRGELSHHSDADGAPHYDYWSFIFIQTANLMIMYIQDFASKLSCPQNIFSLCLDFSCFSENLLLHFFQYHFPPWLFSTSLLKLSKQIFGKSWEFGPTGLTPPPRTLGFPKRKKK